MEHRVRVAVYARVSSDEQRERDTIHNQIDFAHRYAELHGLEIVDVYADDGVTGTIPLAQRPQGRRLLEDARRKRFDVVLVYRLDRLARKTLLLLSICEQLESMGIGVRSMTETFDTSTPAGRAMLGMLATFAGYERDSLVERTALGRERKLRMGRYAGGGVPFGYRVSESGSFQIEPREAEVVRTIFRLYVEEHRDAEAIADYLAAHNVPVRADYLGSHPGHRSVWRPTGVIRVLQNPTYMGKRIYRHNGTEIVQEVPALIDAETFRKAEELRAKNRKAALRNTKRPYLLRGLVRCGLCGLHYVGHSANGLGQPDYKAYYQCMGTKNVNRTLPQRCEGKSVPADLLEGLVWADIRRFVENPGEVLERLEAKVKEALAQQQPVEDELQAIEQAVQAKQAERQRVIHLYRKGTIGEEEAEQELKALARELAELERQKEAVLTRDLRRQQLQNQVVNARVLLEQLRDRVQAATWEDKRQLVEALVENITIDTVYDEQGHKTAKVTIRYRFDGQRGKFSDSESGALGPSSPNTSPGRTSRLTPSTATVHSAPESCACSAAVEGGAGGWALAWSISRSRRTSRGS